MAAEIAMPGSGVASDCPGWVSAGSSMNSYWIAAGTLRRGRTVPGPVGTAGLRSRTGRPLGRRRGQRDKVMSYKSLIAVVAGAEIALDIVAAGTEMAELAENIVEIAADRKWTFGGLLGSSLRWNTGVEIKDKRG